MKRQNNAKGFTIIEVVLVLAIAGLIFLMVFIAWPALQRGQRDTQRREDVSRFISQLNSYATNNRGKVPSSSEAMGTFVTNYLQSGGDDFSDPSTGKVYSIDFATDATPASEKGSMKYHYKFTCDGETPKSGGGDRAVAVTVKLEGSGVFCQSNQ